MNGRLLISGALVAALALGACGKHDGDGHKRAPKSPMADGPSAAERFAAMAPGAIAKRLPADDWPKAAPYAVDRAMTCEPVTGKVWTQQCLVRLKDSERGGETAVVNVLLSDRDGIYEAADAFVAASLNAAPAQVAVARPHRLTMDLGGRAAAMPANCRQKIGAPNSPAFCVIGVSPRIAVVSGVMPKAAETPAYDVMSGGDSDADMGHAYDLAKRGVGVLQKIADKPD